ALLRRSRPFGVPSRLAPGAQGLDPLFQPLHRIAKIRDVLHEAFHFHARRVEGRLLGPVLGRRCRGAQGGTPGPSGEAPSGVRPACLRRRSFASGAVRSTWFTARAAGWYAPALTPSNRGAAPRRPRRG